METIKTSMAMLERIDELRSKRSELTNLAEEMVKREAHYDKTLGLTLVGLKNGKTYQIDGEDVGNIPTTIMLKVAEGICWLEKLEMNKAEAMYRAAFKNIDSIQSELNAFQSINRTLAEV